MDEHEGNCGSKRETWWMMGMLLTSLVQTVRQGGCQRSQHCHYLPAGALLQIDELLLCVHPEDPLICCGFTQGHPGVFQVRLQATLPRLPARLPTLIWKSVSMAVAGMRKSAVVSDSVMAVPKTSTRNSAARRDLERPLGTKDMWQTNAKKWEDPDGNRGNHEQTSGKPRFWRMF